MGAIGELAALVTDGRIGPAIVGTGLAAARLFAMARTLPFLGGRRAPATLHLGLAVTLGLALGPTNIETVPPAAVVAALAVKEVLCGFAVGFLASLPFRFLEQTGVIVDVSRSMQLAGSPAVSSRSGASSPTGNLMLLATMTVFFVTPAHRAFWMGVEATFRAVPVVPAHMPALEAIGTAAVASSAALFASSVMIAFPVLLAVLLTDIAIGAAGRFVPHSGGTFTFLPLRSVVGLGALALALTMLAPVIARLLLDSMGWLERFQ